MAELELANQITRIILRELRHFHVAASDWLNQIREPKKLANSTSTSNQLNAFPRYGNERLVPAVELLKLLLVYLLTL